MKVLVIGDVHGTKLWTNHLNKFINYDKIVFLGDYFDDWHNDWSKVDQIKNLQNILDMQGLYDNKVEVLIGNHDLAYILPEMVSGQQSNKAVDIKEFLLQNIDKFKVACNVGDYVCSHAGFSSYWMQKWGYINIDEVNESFYYKNYEPFKFFGGDPYGNDVLQGPTWIRPEALKYCSFFTKQIVGHTATDKMQTSHLTMKSSFDNKTKQHIYIVDKNDHSAYLELDIKDKEG